MVIPESIRKLAPFASRYTSLQSWDGPVRMHYYDEEDVHNAAGPSDALPLICLHGNPTWSFYYRNVIAALRTRRRVIAMDHIGCGASARPRNYPYCLAQHIRNFSEFMAKVCPSRVHLLLHDWGGAIGLGWAVRNPDRVGKIILTNTAAFISGRIPLRIAAGKIPLLGEFAIRRLNAFVRAALVMAPAKPLPAEVRRALLWPYKDYQSRIAVHRFVQDIPLHPGHRSFRLLQGIGDQLADLPQGMILWGEKDFCFNHHFLRRWQSIWPDADVRLFPAGGHYLLEDQTRGCLQAIEQYLNKG